MDNPRDVLVRTIQVIEDGMEAGLHIGAQLYVSQDGKTVADFGLGEARQDVTWVVHDCSYRFRWPAWIVYEGYPSPANSIRRKALGPARSVFQKVRGILKRCIEVHLGSTSWDRVALPRNKHSAWRGAAT